MPPVARRPARAPIGARALNALAHALLALGAVFMILPMLWMLSTSFKAPPEIPLWPPHLLPRAPTLANYTGIFLVRQHVASAIPSELLEAARVDGATEWWILARVIAPLSGTALAAVGIFGFIQMWGAFLWPLLVANNQLLFNMEVGLTAFQFRFSSDHGKLMAGSVISVIPMLVIFLILRRRIIESVALTGLKG